MRHWVIVVIIFFFSLGATAQCKKFAIEECLPILKPFVSNGQLNKAALRAGEAMEVEVVFNKGLLYRLIVCTESTSTDAVFIIKDELDNYLYQKTFQNGFATKDIEVDQTRPLKINVQLFEKENATKESNSDCVSLIVGFKEQN